ncbi:MAG: hypothetical protein IKM28_06765 [Lachnospiraceae bacterium]|nr:hypothetical protein [Lachnospiraceae bacterium]
MEIKNKKVEMKELEKYIDKKLKIWNIDTYLMDAKYTCKVMELLNLHKMALSIWQVAEKVKTVELYPAVIYIPHFSKDSWIPILCLKNREKFYHVYYHSGWMCRACWSDNGSVIMPMSEADTVYNQFSFSPIPAIFQKVNCKKCGIPLQNHLILVKEE